MPEFAPLFFQPLKIELSESEKCELETLLHTIYNGRPINYERLTDFESCKTQLIALLDYISAIDPTKLDIFTRYKAKVCKLVDTGSLLDIGITLKAAKQSIELSLLAIIKNHFRVDKTALDSLVVNLCYSGAFSNIEYALGYFQVDALAFYIDNAKSQLLLELAQQFLLENKIIERAGNDIHYANGLYNTVASHYGLKPKEDPFGNVYSEVIHEKFTHYLRTNFTASSFLQFCTTFFPMPPQIEIRDNEQFKQLTEFFQPFEKDGAIREKYLRLYDEREDSFDVILTPKPEFQLYCAGLLASYLEEKGYINDLHIRIDEKIFLYTGEVLIGVNADGTYRVLTDEELLSPVITPILDSLSLWSQLTVKTLLKLYKKCVSDIHITREYYALVVFPERVISQCEMDKKRYFTALLAKPFLPPSLLEVLLHDIENNNDSDSEEVKIAKSQLADYIFSNSNYESTLELRVEQLNSLAKTVTEKKKTRCLIELIKSDKVTYVRSLLSQHPEWLVNISHQLPAIAAKSGALNVLSLLHHDLKIDLATFDEKGVSPACYAASTGQVAILEKLHEFGIALNAANDKGKTPAHYVAENGKVAALVKLRELGVPLDIKDSHGFTPAHYAAQFGQVEIIDKLHELLVPLDVVNDFGTTLAHLAARHGQVKILEKLDELKVSIDTQNKEGLTPLHFAAKAGKVEALEKLISLGIFPDSEDNAGRTAAHFAAQFGQIEILEKLASMDTDLDQEDKKHLRPAHYASMKGHIAILAKHEELKMSLSQGNHNGYTPMHAAAQHGQLEALEKLHELGISYEVTDGFGATPAHYAATNGRIDILQRLYELGVPLDIKNKIGLTPADYATKFNQPTALAKLKELATHTPDTGMPSSASPSFFQPAQENDNLAQNDEALVHHPG